MAQKKASQRRQEKIQSRRQGRSTTQVFADSAKGFINSAIREGQGVAGKLQASQAKKDADLNRVVNHMNSKTTKRGR